MDTLYPRFWSKVNKTDGCWLWTAYTSTSGYGRFRLNTRTDYAHRVAYALTVGPIPEGTEIDHLCRNPSCVNPAHLEAVTRADHAQRSLAARKTHCVNGHAFDEENTHPRRNRNGTGQRCCLACRREASRRYRARVAA